MALLLRVLIVEDSRDDTELMARFLKLNGYEVSFEQVSSAAACKSALDREVWDIVIADYALPGFSGLEALEICKKFGLDLPFIIVSGTIGEDIAVEAMKAGAHDYVMKGNLARLLPAIQRELREARVREGRRLAEAALRESAATYQTLLSIARPR
jgi:DNA-binding NtrC family response regulator